MGCEETLRVALPFIMKVEWENETVNVKLRAVPTRIFISGRTMTFYAGDKWLGDIMLETFRKT